MAVADITTAVVEVTDMATAEAALVPAVAAVLATVPAAAVAVAVAAVLAQAAVLVAPVTANRNNRGPGICVARPLCLRRISPAVARAPGACSCRTTQAPGTRAVALATRGVL